MAHRTLTPAQESALQQEVHTLMQHVERLHQWLLAEQIDPRDDRWKAIVRMRLAARHLGKTVGTELHVKLTSTFAFSGHYS